MTISLGTSQSLGKFEEGMNLYTKMIESGYAPDWLTFYLLLKILCEEERLDLAIQISKEMRTRGYDMDLATCTMNKFKEALAEFEGMLHRGLVPQYLTFQNMNNEQRKQGMTEIARKLCALMSSVPHSTKLPNTYVKDRVESHERRKSIIQKAEAMSKGLKTCSDPKKLVKLRSSPETDESRANRLMDDIKAKANIK